MWNFVLILFSLFLGRAELVNVRIEQGLLEGEQLDLVTGDGYYYSFKGVPYAAPPLGHLRFKAPEPPISWNGTLSATKHGPVCIQYDIFSNKTVYGSEDCLYVNVYSPDLKPDEPIPVMVYIHGGGYEADSGNVDHYGPDFLVQQNVVLVTFNYRLGALGFLSLDTKEVPGNAGLKDQVAALRWVKKNIRNFGGDPENVTIFGQSAGGAATIFHVLSPMSKGLFKRAIAMSGVPSCDWSIPFKHRKRAFLLGNILGMNTEDPHELLVYLQSVPADKLVSVGPALFASEELLRKSLRMFYYTPVIEKDFGDENFITKEPEKILKEGEINVHELMLGHTSEEGIVEIEFNGGIIPRNYAVYNELLIPRKIMYDISPNQILELSDIIKKHYFGTKSLSGDTLRELLTYLSDSTFGYDIQRYTEMFYKLNSRVYVYRFSGVSERNIYGTIDAKYNLSGAGHSDDTAHLFDPKDAKLKLVKNSKAHKIIKNLSTLFANFAKHGNPTPNNDLGISWPAYDNVTQGYMDISDSLKVDNALDNQAVEFWRSLYDRLHVEFDYFLKLYGK